MPDSEEAIEFANLIDNLAGGDGWLQYLRVIDGHVAASPLAPEVKEALVTRVTLFSALWWRQPLQIVQPLLEKYLSYELPPLAPFQLGTVVTDARRLPACRPALRVPSSAVFRPISRR